MISLPALRRPAGGNNYGNADFNSGAIVSASSFGQFGTRSISAPRKMPFGEGASIPFSMARAPVPFQQSKTSNAKGKQKTSKLLGFFNQRFAVSSTPQSVPRPLPLPCNPNRQHGSAALSRLMWGAQVNPRVEKGSGMLARLERLRQAAIELHRNVQQNRSALLDAQREFCWESDATPPTRSSPTLVLPPLSHPPTMAKAETAPLVLASVVSVQKQQGLDDSLSSQSPHRWLADIRITFDTWEVDESACRHVEGSPS